MTGFLANLIARAGQSPSILQRRRPALFEAVIPFRSVSAELQRYDEFSLDRAAVADTPPSQPSSADVAAAPPQPPSSSLAHLIARTKQDAPVLQRRRVVLLEPPVPTQPSSLEPEEHQESPQDRQSIAGISRNRSSRAFAAESSGQAMSSSLAATFAIQRPDLRVGSNGEFSAMWRNGARGSPAAGGEHAASIREGHAILAREPDLPGVPDDETHSARPATPVHSSDLRDERLSPTYSLIPAVPRMNQAVQLVRAIEPLAGISSSFAANGRSTVRISIGRVEIRAVISSERPPVRTAKPSTPRLTLDGYLQQRSQGAR